MKHGMLRVCFDRFVEQQSLYMIMKKLAERFTIELHDSLLKDIDLYSNTQAISFLSENDSSVSIKPLTITL